MNPLENCPEANNHDSPLPRLIFEFDPHKIGIQQEFNITIPRSDIDSAEPLNPPLEYMPELTLGHSFMQTLLDQVADNDGGSLALAQDRENVTVHFGFKQLPEPLSVPKNLGLTNIRELTDYKYKNRMPHLEGRLKILKSVAQITNLQYQYVVPAEQVKPSSRIPFSRFSFADGYDLNAPVVIASEAFDKTLSTISPQISEKLTKDTESYLLYVDPFLKKRDRLGIMLGIMIARDHKIFTNGFHNSFGQRNDIFSQLEISTLETERDFRLWPGDLYQADILNSGEIPNVGILAMVAVGSINRFARLALAQS